MGVSCQFYYGISLCGPETGLSVTCGVNDYPSSGLISWFHWAASSLACRGVSREQHVPFALWGWTGGSEPSDFC